MSERSERTNVTAVRPARELASAPSAQCPAKPTERSERGGETGSIARPDGSCSVTRSRLSGRESGEFPEDPADGLDDEQRAAVAAPRGPVCVLAGAGTGKTRTITHRIAHLVRAGARRSGSGARRHVHRPRRGGDAHPAARAGRRRGAGAHVPRRRAAPAALLLAAGRRRRAVASSLEGKLRLVGQAAARARGGHRRGVTARPRRRDRVGQGEPGHARRLPGASSPGCAATSPVRAEQVAAVYAGYEELKNRAELLDFDDLLLHTAAALEEHRGVAEEFRDRYRCFVVDEYQDVTPLQQRRARRLARRPRRPDASSATRTRRSTPSPAPTRGYLLDFPRRFPDAAVVRLMRDYRSTPQVVAAANTLIGSRARAGRGNAPAAGRAAAAGAGPAIPGVRRRARRGRGRRPARSGG